MRDRAPCATDLCDRKPFWADLVIWRIAIDPWLGATQKDMLKDFEWKVRETEWENAKAVGIHELCGRWRREMLLLITRLRKRESCRKRISRSYSIVVGKIAVSGLLKDSCWLIRTYYVFSSSHLSDGDTLGNIFKFLATLNTFCFTLSSAMSSFTGIDRCE